MLCPAFLWIIVAVLRNPALGTNAFTVPPRYTTHRNHLSLKKYVPPALKATLSDPNLGIQIAQQVQPSVVLVTPKGVRNMTARGSGFILSHTEEGNEEEQGRIRYDYHLPDPDALYIITAAHVAIPGYTIEVTVPTIDTATATNATETADEWIGGSDTLLKCTATVVARNTTMDLALLRVDDPVAKLGKNHTELGGLQLARYHPPVGTLAFAHGYPASRLRGPAMTLGIVCGLADGLGLPKDTFGTSSSEGTETDNDSTIFVVTDAATSGGMSGGPLVNGRGLVMGVNALIRPDLRALGNYAVSSLEVLDFLQSIPSSDAMKNDNTNTAASQFKVWLCEYRLLLYRTFNTDFFCRVAYDSPSFHVLLK